ncbi:hypothetical protein ACWD00_05825 [Streptomyces viridiviolaceus]
MTGAVAAAVLVHGTLDEADAHRIAGVPSLAGERDTAGADRTA